MSFLRAKGQFPDSLPDVPCPDESIMHVWIFLFLLFCPTQNECGHLSVKFQQNNTFGNNIHRMFRVSPALNSK